LKNKQLPLMSMKHIIKRYGDVIANNDVSINLYQGEILAIIGENGAGKSTLMKVLYGLEIPQQGEVFLHGEKVKINKPADALAMGIGMLQQHFMLFGSLTVAENIVYNNEIKKRRIFYDRKKNNAIVKELSEKYRLKVQPEVVVNDYPVGLQQRVEILKILYQNPNIIIFDEPSGILTPLEVEELLKNMKALREMGKTIILITHKLHEVLAVADRVIVMRAGEVVYRSDIKDTSTDVLAFQIVGRRLTNRTIKQAHSTDPMFVVKNLIMLDMAGKSVLNHINFHVCRGEVVGIAGVSGNGQSELIRCITGLLPYEHGEVFINEKSITNAPVNKVREAGVAHIPEDRFFWGSAAYATLTENAIMGYEGLEPLSRHGVFRTKQLKAHTKALIDEYKVKAGAITDKIKSLSGGNMQKLIVAREMKKKADLIIANEPTRGIDIGAMEFIHDELIKKRDQGMGVLLVSSELSEILELSDRIYVLFEGKICGEFKRGSIDGKTLGLLMVGGTLDNQKDTHST